MAWATSEDEFFAVDAAAWYAEGAQLVFQTVREAARPAHVDVALRDVGHKLTQRRLVEGSLGA